MSVPSDDGDRPRKSWRERDKGRDRSRHVQTSSDRERERFEKTTAYSRYKQGLERVFAGGELSPELRDRLDPTGKGKARDALLKQVRDAEDPKSFAQAIDRLLAEFDFPDDPYLLDRALDHPKVEVLLRALRQLLTLVGEGRLAKPPRSLTQRLDALLLNSDDEEVQRLAKELKPRLK